MWYVMDNIQRSYQLSDRLIRAISNWQTLRGTEDDVEELLNAGADVNRVHGTLLPLHCACMVSDSYIVQLLLERGAQVDAIDGYGRAALHYAAEKDVVCVELLLDHGAQANLPDNNQDTPLHWAAFKNQVQCVRALLQRGANVNATDYNSDTPLSWAAMKGNYDTLKVLLEYNCDVNIPNYTGQNAIARCATVQATGLDEENMDACLQLLISAGGQFDIRDTQGRLPDIIHQDNKLHELLSTLCESPRTLQDICRHSIRKCMGQRYLPNLIRKLPLPARLREFLSLHKLPLNCSENSNNEEVNVL